MAVHLFVPVLLTQAATRAMLENPGPDGPRGRLLNVASIAVMTPRAGITNYAAGRFSYCHRPLPL